MATLDDLKSETQLTTSVQALVSTTSSEKKFIGNMTLTNTSTSNVEVTFWRIATSSTETTGSSGNSLFTMTIPANDWVKVQKMSGHVLGHSMKLSAVAATTGVINVDISGTTET